MKYGHHLTGLVIDRLYNREGLPKMIKQDKTYFSIGSRRGEYNRLVWNNHSVSYES